MNASKLELSVALSDNPNTRPLIDGHVEAEGIRLIPSAVHPSEMFWRQLRFGEFDVSEMSMSSLLISTARGPTPWVALPVFTTREFFHTRILVRADAGIAAPADLRGKRVGVPEYQQTAAIWGRGVLQHEFGVSAREIVDLAHAAVATDLTGHEQRADLDHVLRRPHMERPHTVLSGPFEQRGKVVGFTGRDSHQ